MSITLGQMAYSASKLIEYTDGEAKVVKDKEHDIEQNTGVVVHLSHQQYNFIDNELRELSRLRAALAVLQTTGGKVDAKN